MSNNLEEGITITRAVNYEKAYVIYKVKIKNNFPHPVAKIKVKPFISTDLFILDKESDKIDLLEPSDSNTITFKLRPHGECGNVKIKGNVSYYDTKSMENNELSIQPVETEIICPMLKRIAISDEEWEQKISNLLSFQERTKESPIGKDEFFDIITDVLKDMNMYHLDPKIGNMRNVGRFYCEGVKGLSYAVKVEVIGGKDKSKMILKAYAENEASLVGCYYKILDEVEERTDIKKYIDEKIVNQYYYGDVVSGTKVEARDSIIQRSPIGVKESINNGAAPICSACKNIITENNKILRCKKCRNNICQECESWIEKKDEYEGTKLKFKYPLCEDCYEKSYKEKINTIKLQNAPVKEEEPISQEESIELGRCGSCGELVPADQPKCPKCGVSFGGEIFECPICKAMVSADEPKCTNCGAEFEIDTKTYEEKVNTINLENASVNKVEPILEKESTELAKCGSCGELVPADQPKCPKCGVSFGGEIFECPICKAMVSADEPKCTNCGAEFEIDTKTFQEFWNKLTHELKNEQLIRNWTNDRGYLHRGDFRAIYKKGNYIDCILEDQSVLTVPKKDFKVIYENWDDYVGGRVKRPQLRDKSRFTKYTISILHQYDNLM